MFEPEAFYIMSMGEGARDCILISTGTGGPFLRFHTCQSNPLVQMDMAHAALESLSVYPGVVHPRCFVFGVCNRKSVRNRRFSQRFSHARSDANCWLPLSQRALGRRLQALLQGTG